LAKYPLSQIAIYRLLVAYKNEATSKFGRGSPSHSARLVWKPGSKVTRITADGAKVIQGAFVPTEGIRYFTEEGKPIIGTPIYVTVADVFEAIHGVVEEVEEIKRRSDIKPLTDYANDLLLKTSKKEPRLTERAAKIGFEVYDREHVKRDQLIDTLVKDVTPGALARLKAYYFTRITDIVRKKDLDQLRSDELFWEEIELMRITREIVHHIRERYKLRLRDLAYA